MRKLLLLFIILFINSCLCSFAICLYNEYKTNNKELSNILSDKEYSLLFSIKNEEKNLI